MLVVLGQLAQRASSIQTVTLAFNKGRGWDDVSIVLDVANGITGQTVMEIAANKNATFRFTSSYFGSDLGYFLLVIGGYTPGFDEYWQLQVGKADSPPYSVSPVGYSKWYPFNGSIMRWVVKFGAHKDR